MSLLNCLQQRIGSLSFLRLMSNGRCLRTDTIMVPHLWKFSTAVIFRVKYQIVFTSTSGQKKKQKGKEYDCFFDCLESLTLLCRELKNGLEDKYNAVIPQNLKDLNEAFDLELQVIALCMWIRNRKIATGKKGRHISGRLDEDYMASTFYMNEDVVKTLGQELCIAIDVALAGNGCEAVVEGFYSVVKAHKQSGEQSNGTLMQRTIVDWGVPHPLSSPETMQAIATLYAEGNEDCGLKKHRLPLFFCGRQRAAQKYNVSKLVAEIVV
eukprot:gene17276-19003_t